MDIFGIATIGLHIASVHVPAKDWQNNVNPGIYVRNEVGTQVGTFYNTNKKMAVYVIQHVPIADSVSVFGGITSGYQTTCQTKVHGDGSVHEKCTHGLSKNKLNPMLGIGYAPDWKVMDVAPRFSFVPPTKHTSAVFHMSVEF